MRQRKKSFAEDVSSVPIQSPPGVEKEMRLSASLGLGVLLLMSISGCGRRPIEQCACTPTGEIACGEGPLCGSLDFYIASTHVEGVTDAVLVRGTKDETCALRKNGRVVCWAARYYPTDSEGFQGPHAIEGIERAAEIVVGNNFACALDEVGTVRCWAPEQKQAVLSVFSDATSVAASDSSVCIASAVQPEIICRDLLPQQFQFGALRRVRTANPVKKLSISYSQGCVVDNQGAVLCWPRKKGTEGAVDLVRDLPEIASDITVGDHHSCAITFPSKQVLCWGANEDGQLGDGTLRDRPQPEPVLGVQLADQVVASGYLTCARLREGAVVCWGTAPGGKRCLPKPPELPLVRDISVDGYGFVYGVEETGLIYQLTWGR